MTAKGQAQGATRAPTNPHASSPHAASPHGQAGATTPGAVQGKVLETMDSGGYTYVLVESSQGKTWAAAPVTKVAVGNIVGFSGGMPMQQFTSNTLKRTFDVIYFVPGLTVNGVAPASPAKAGALAAKGASPAAMDIGTVAKADKKVSELFAEKDALVGKTVAVRGKVVKYNAGIMGRNWIHLRDGSGSEGTNDLTVTTSESTQVGATVLVKGQVVLNKDFGAGYKYDLILEGASVKAE